MTVTNSPAWNGLDYIFPFGEPEVATFGQVFTTDATNTVMDGFTFHLRSEPGGSVDFRGFVAAWDGSKLSGAVLFESGLQTLPSGTNLFQAFTFDTAGLSLAPGAQYVAFLSTSKDFDSVDGIADIGTTASSDTYTGGNMVIALNGSNFGALSTDPWIELDGMDFAFSMDFSADGAGAVPEPPGFALAGAAALLGLAASRRFRRV